jgi:hypothetical protein
MRKQLLTRIAAGLMLGASLAACSDQPMSTEANAKVTIKTIKDFETYQVVDFTVDTEGGWFRVGPHSVYFPANSICDPAKSTYGPGEWDKPCEVIADSIDIHAEIQKSLTSGKPAIRFWPDLRFAPDTTTGVGSTESAISERWVVLYMFTEDALNASDAQVSLLEAKYRILWSPIMNATPIDESLKDPSLMTRVLRTEGLVYRRVKHFSGYQVGSGSGGTEAQ